jgi:hypothetical protein
MKFKIFTIILPILLLVASCGESKKEAEHDDHGANPVELNAGAKWKANPETVDGIKNMQAICTANATQITDAAAVSAALMDEFNMIFQKCTMTGPAHDQLHNYLLPLKAHVEELGACTSDCTKHLNHISAFLGDFDKYFEL